MEIQYSQLKINHLKDTPSTKAARGGIYSGVLLKDVKVPVKVRRTLSSVGTSSSNKWNSLCEDSYTESLCCESAFAHKKEFYIFKFPKRFSEISCVDIGLVEKPFQHTCLYHLQDCVVNGDYLAI